MAGAFTANFKEYCVGIVEHMSMRCFSGVIMRIKGLGNTLWSTREWI